MGNFKGRVERLEGNQKAGGVPIIAVMPGESTEEAWQRHLAQHPESKTAEHIIIINIPG